MSDQLLPPLAVLDGMRQSEWIAQSGLSRSQAYLLIKELGIKSELRKVPGVRKPQPFLTNEDVALLTPQAVKLADGMPLKQLVSELGLDRPKPSSALAVQDGPGMADLIKVMAPPADPLKLAKQLKEAADLGVPLTNQEMATVLGRSEVKPDMDGYSPRPGYVIHRIEHNGRPYWTVRAQTVQDSPALRPVGFGLAADAPIAACLDVQVMPRGLQLPSF